MKPKVAVISALILVAVLSAFIIPGLGKTQSIKTLTFSNTMSWEPDLFEKLDDKVYFLPDWEQTITLPDPPVNDSEITLKELDDLVKMKTQRTDEAVKAINDEKEKETTRFGDYFISDYYDPAKFPKTAKLLEPTFADASIILLKVKEEHNRVRPHILRPEIEPIIPIPGHPAYPSGHATQMHLYARIFSEFAPERRDEFERRAWEIGTHRELAGVHYRSDTEGGRRLANQLMGAFMRNEKFRMLLEDAKSEWQN